MAKRRSTKFIVMHCTASSGRLSVSSLRKQHRDRGFRDIGYGGWVDRDSKEQKGRGYDEIGAHVAGYNTVSVGVAWEGGYSGNDATPDQMDKLLEIVKRLLKKYPGALVTGHRDLSPDGDRDGVVEPHEWTKTCPRFNAEVWAASHGLPHANFSGMAGNGPRDPVVKGPDDRILWLQKLLRLQGKNIVADGHEGPKTEQAVLEFERENGLPGTGSLDTRPTVDLLKKLSAKDARTETPAKITAVVRDVAKPDSISTTNVAAGVTAVTTIAGTGKQVAETVTDAKSSVDMLIGAGPWVLLLCVGLGAGWWIWRERNKRKLAATEALGDV